MSRRRDGAPRLRPPRTRGTDGEPRVRRRPQRRHDRPPPRGLRRRDQGTAHRVAPAPPWQRRRPAAARRTRPGGPALAGDARPRDHGLQRRRELDEQQQPASAVERLGEDECPVLVGRRPELQRGRRRRHGDRRQPHRDQEPQRRHADLGAHGPTMAAAWSSMITALRAHEARHEGIANTWETTLRTNLTGLSLTLPSRTTAAFTSAVQSEWNGWLAQHQADQTAIDPYSALLDCSGGGGEESARRAVAGRPAGSWRASTTSSSSAASGRSSPTRGAPRTLSRRGMRQGPRTREMGSDDRLEAARCRPLG